MIITKISDGFGNQMFMYATAYALAKRLDAELMLDISYLDTNTFREYELDKLNIVYDKCFSTRCLKFYPLKVLARRFFHGMIKLKYGFYHERKPYFYDPNFNEIKDNTYLFGYWQTEKYFKAYRKELLQMFTPKYALSEDSKQYIMQVQRCNSVAIHIRRGDYVKLGICLDSDYYHNSIKFIEEKLKSDNIIYFVFSDDLEFAKSMLEPSSHRKLEFVKCSSNNATLDDFFIMKSCKHIIMANSSFSWWAAWLNDNPDKIVLYPVSDKKNDFYPDEWIGETDI